MQLKIKDPAERTSGGTLYNQEAEASLLRKCENRQENVEQHCKLSILLTDLASGLLKVIVCEWEETRFWEIILHVQAAFRTAPQPPPSRLVSGCWCPLVMGEAVSGHTP